MERLMLPNAALPEGGYLAEGTSGTRRLELVHRTMEKVRAARSAVC
jgi:hypothetical protein